LAVIYFWKVIEAVYFKPRPQDAPIIHEVPLVMLFPMWVLVGANIYFGVNTDLSVGAASAAANLLIGGTP